MDANEANPLGQARRDKIPRAMRVTFLVVAALAASAISGCDGDRAARETTTAARTPDVATAEQPATQSLGRDFAMAMRYYREGDRIRALQRFTELAEEGDANAQYSAGVMLAEGQGVQQDWSAAIEWYRKAAAQNQPDALRALARLHVFGMEGVERDIPKAIELYGRAEQAYPPGEQRDSVAQQKQALIALQD